MSLDPANTNALLQHQTICCIEVVSLLEMKVSPTSIENAVATLKRDVVATFWQRSANIVTTLQSNNSTNALQHLFNIVSTLPQPIFWYSL